MRTLLIVASVAASLVVAGTPVGACEGMSKAAQQTAKADSPSQPKADQAACACGMGAGGKCCTAGAAGDVAASTAPAPDGEKAPGCGCGKKKPAGS